MTRRQREVTVAALSATTAATAVGGAVFGLSGASNIPREWLRGSPFRDYRVPSLILGLAVGGSSMTAAAAAWHGSDCAAAAAVIAGAVLLGWIGAQVAIIGPRSVLQPAMAGIGAVLIGLGASLR